MGRRLARYDPRAVIASFGATPILEGAAAGTFITLERVKRTWDHRKGVDGEGARVRTNNFAGLVRFSLRAGALTNNALAAQLQTDELTGLIVAPFFLLDYSGTTIWSSPVSWLEGWPREAFGENEEIREWALTCDPLVPFPGGSQSI